MLCCIPTTVCMYQYTPICTYANPTLVSILSPKHTNHWVRLVEQRKHNEKREAVFDHTLQHKLRATTSEDAHSQSNLNPLKLTSKILA